MKFSKIIVLIIAIEIAAIVLLGAANSSVSPLKNRLSQSIGPSWKEGFAYYDKTIKSNNIRMYIDGEYILFPEIDLKIGEGQFMDVIVAVKGWYLDSRGREQFVYLPVLTRFPDGRLYRAGFMFPDIIDWSDEEIPQKLNPSGEFLRGGKPGFIDVEVYPDVDAAFDAANPGWKDSPEIEYIAGLLKQWTQANPESLEKFLDTGDPAIETLFVEDLGEERN